MNVLPWILALIAFPLGYLVGAVVYSRKLPHKWSDDDYDTNLPTYNELSELEQEMYRKMFGHDPDQK